mgnify:CR=1 FL=1
MQWEKGEEKKNPIVKEQVSEAVTERNLLPFTLQLLGQDKALGTEGQTERKEQHH